MKTKRKRKQNENSSETKQLNSTRTARLPRAMQFETNSMLKKRFEHLQSLLEMTRSCTKNTPRGKSPKRSIAWLHNRDRMIDRSIVPSIDRFFDRSIVRSIVRSIDCLNDGSNDQSNKRPIDHSNNQSINQSAIDWPIKRSINPTTDRLEKRPVYTLSYAYVNAIN